MKKNNLYIICLLAMASALFASCLKKIDIPQTNNVKVALTDGGANYVIADKTVNPKDSLFFSFTITSDKDMKYVGLQKNAADAKTFVLLDTLTAATKNSFSATKKIAADSASGAYKYRIVALDAQGIYLGSSEVVVTVSPDFIYYTVRILQVPDTTAKTNKCYFSTVTGNTYSYTDGAANSANIDFGYLYDTATANKHTIYALNTSPIPSQVAFYDITTWTKNATIFKKGTIPAFTALTSGSALKNGGLSNLASGATSKVTALVAGNVVFFKTAAGKYGAFTVNYLNADSPAASTFISLDVKIQK